MGSGEALALSCRPCRCLDAHSQCFPLQNQHVMKQHPATFHPDLPGASPCCCPARRPCARGKQASPTPSAGRSHTSSSLMLLCASASWDLASMCQGYAPLPLQLLSLGCIIRSIPSSRLGLLCTSHFPSCFALIYTRSWVRGPFLGRGGTAPSIRCISKHDFQLSVSRYSSFLQRLQPYRGIVPT